MSWRASDRNGGTLMIIIDNMSHKNWPFICSDTATSHLKKVEMI